MSGGRVIAITGGTGFVGGHLVRMAAEAGWQVRALTRRRRPLLGGVTWIEGSLEDGASLTRLVDGADAVVHVAGVINAATRAGFVAGNATGTLNLIEAMTAGGPRRLVHVSSLAAREPELSDYGWSKARSEAIVAASGLDWTIVRPPAVYGPGDRETFELFRMARRGVVGLPSRGRLSLIHVADLSGLLLRLAEAPESLARTLEPDDGRPDGWSHVEFASAIAAAIGRERVRTFTAPIWLLRAAVRVDALVRGDRAKLTRDRVGYMVHPDWVVTATARPQPALWQPRIETRAGLAATAAWYRAEGWLR